MNRLRIAGAAGFLAALLPFAVVAAPVKPSRVALPGGTAVRVHLTAQLSSGSAHEGDRFAFTVSDDVRCNGWLVIPAGAQGMGQVVGVENAGGNGHPGKLDLQFDYVYAADGEKVRVSPTAATAEGEQRAGAASTATIATYALLGPAGLFAHNWVKGREVSIDTKTAFTVTIEETVHVEAADRVAESTEFAR